MFLFSIIYIISSILLVFGATAIYNGNRKSTKHKAFALVFIFMALWQESALLITTVPPQLAGYVFVYGLIPLLLCSFVLMLHAVYLITDVYKRKHSLLYKLLFIPPIINIVLGTFEGWLYKGEITAYESQPPLGPGSFINFATIFIYLIVMISLLIPQVRKKHRPSQIWMTGIVLFALWVLIIVLIGELAKFSDSFSLVPLGVIFWAGAVYISVSKYDSLSSYETRYNVLLDKAPVGILITDNHAIIKEASPRAAQHLGLPLNKMLGQSLFSRLSPEENNIQTTYYMEQFYQRKPMQQYEFSYQDDDNRVKSLSISSEFMEMEGEHYQLLIIEDITESRLREKQIHELAYFDQLTGLYNRVSFILAFEEWKERNAPFALLLFDLDGFKQINDRYGHLAGDQALKHFAEKLNACVGSSDFVARLSGDEFAMLMYNVDETDRLIQDIQIGLKESFEVSQTHRLVISTSVGVSKYPIDGKDYTELFKLADDRMYDCKHANRELKAKTSS